MKSAVIFLDPKGTILEVVRVAKDRGYHVVALMSDRTLIENAPMPYSSVVPLIDEVIQVESWSDEAQVFFICREINSRTPIVGLYAGMDPCAVILAKLREEYGLPTSSPAALSLVLNKLKIRQKLTELGLSKIKTYHSSEIGDWATWVPTGAAYFKPLHGFFSAYVRRCTNMEELTSARSAWNAGNADEPAWLTKYVRSSPEYLVEDAFDGELLSVEAIASGGEVEVLGLLSRILYSKNPVVEMGSCFPYPHKESDKIIRLVVQAHKSLGLTDGPTHTEVIVNSRGDVEIIDLNPRFVGADVLQSINFAYGIKVQETLFDFTIGVDAKISPKADQFSCIQYFLPPEIPVLTTTEFPEIPELKFSTTFIRVGSQVANTKRQIDYLGCYLTVMPTFQEAINRSMELRSAVKVNSHYLGEY